MAFAELSNDLVVSDALTHAVPFTLNSLGSLRDRFVRSNHHQLCAGNGEARFCLQRWSLAALGASYAHKHRTLGVVGRGSKVR
jgi:hypothetical protein